MLRKYDESNNNKVRKATLRDDFIDVLGRSFLSFPRFAFDVE